MKKISVIIAIVVVAGVAGWWFWRASTRPAGPESAQPSTQPSTPSQEAYYPNPDLEQAYESKLQIILSDFEGGESSDTARDRILALTVPDKHKNVHLELAIIFEKLMVGQASQDQSVIEDALEQLDALKQKQPWLTP